MVLSSSLIFKHTHGARAKVHGMRSTKARLAPLHLHWLSSKREQQAIRMHNFMGFHILFIYFPYTCQNRHYTLLVDFSYTEWSAITVNISHSRKIKFKVSNHEVIGVYNIDFF